MKFKPYEQMQMKILPSSIEEMIPKEHLVRVIDSVVEELDLTELYRSYPEEGQPAYHPKMLIKVLLYGYSINERSSRKLSEKLRSDVFYMYLSGMQRPDFRTISDFRLKKRKYLEGCFIEVLGICSKMGLYKLEHVSIDGSKIKANASKKKTKEEQGVVRYEEKVKKILDEAEEKDRQEDEEYGEKSGYEIPEELRDKEKLLERIRKAKEELKKEKQKRINMTDKDARLMKKGDGTIDICYNAQIAVDKEKGIITACGVIKQETDNYALAQIYEKVLENTGKKPEEISADAGYYSGKTYQYLETNQIDGYVPDTRYEKEYREGIGKYDRRNFIYDQGKDEYICPANERLRFKKNSKRNGVKFKEYRAISCKECKEAKECISHPTAEYRQIQIYENEEYKQKMYKKLVSKEGRRKYKQRMKIVEPVFAQLKYIMGFNKFMLRGLEKVKAEFSLVCTAYNIKKIAKLLPA